MTLKKISWISALVFGAATLATVQGAEIQSGFCCGSELVSLFKNEGIRKPVDHTVRSELNVLFKTGAQLGHQIDPSCLAESVAEIYLKKDLVSVLSGYEVFVACEDLPTAAIALYFDLVFNFLGSVDLAE